jgi:threonine/homoserine/homoserine lactone efflux protein
VSLAYLASCLLLAITPGPGVAFVVARTLERGRAAGLASVLGVALGNLGNGIGAALGLALLFESAPMAYEIVKIAGVAYLVFLGVTALRRAQDASTSTPETRPLRILRDGLLVAISNPKTALFFAAFLPHFAGRTPSVLDAIGLVATFVAIAASTDAGYVLLASRIAPMLETPRARTVLRWGPALVYFGLAIVAAVG